MIHCLDLDFPEVNYVKYLTFCALEDQIKYSSLKKHSSELLRPVVSTDVKMLTLGRLSYLL